MDCSQSRHKEPARSMAHGTSPTEGGTLGEPAAAGRRAQGVAELVWQAVGVARLLRSRWPIVAGCLVAAGLVGAVHYATARRIYESRATVLVTPGGSDDFESGSSSSRLQDRMPTFVKLFDSGVVLDAAARKLAASRIVRATDLRDVPRAKWAQQVREQVTARGVRRTQLIELAYRSKDPRAAAASLQAVMEAYLEFIQHHHRGVATDIATLLDRERRSVLDKIATKQEELRDIRHRLRALGLVDQPDTVHPVVARVMALNDSLIKVRSQYLEVVAQAAALEEAVQHGADLRAQLLKIEPMVGREVVLAALGLDAQSSESAMTVQRQLMADRAELESLSAHYGPGHPRYQALQKRIRQAEVYLQQRASGGQAGALPQDPARVGQLLQAMLEDRRVTLQAEEQQLLKAYEAAESQAVALNDQWSDLQMIQHDLKLLHDLHDTLVSQLAQLDLRKNHADVRIAVVNPPRVPDAPVSPNARNVFAGCLAVGLLVGLLLAYGADLMDDRFRSPEQLQEQTRLPLLTVVGRLAEQTTRQTVAAAGVDTEAEADRESFRTLRTTLHFADTDLQTIAVTSAEPGDGKTTVLANLAVSMAQAGKRVLMLDADLRKPGLSRLAELRGRPGLSDVLLSTDELSGDVIPNVFGLETWGVDVIPCGRRTGSPTELLQKDRFADVVAWAEDRYDVVLIDCPPVLAAADAMVVGRRSHGMILVVQPGKNKRQLVLRTVSRLRSVGVNLVGLVANRVDRESEGDYGGYGYGYGYHYGEMAEEDRENEVRESRSPQERRAA